MKKLKYWLAGTALVASVVVAYANLNSVGITNGVPTSGTGTVSTLDQLIAVMNTTWAGGTLGAMANYGTSPGAVLVPGVNAFVTNTNANGQATSANSSSVVIASDQSAIPTTKASQYPLGAIAITASATGTTGATTATLAASGTGKTTYLCSLSIRSNATAAATGNATVTGTITGTLNFTHWTAPNASGIGITEQIYSPCVPGSAVNTGIAVISPAPGTGGVVSVTGTGYQL